MSKLYEFRSMIDDINDKEVLEVARGLLRDMMKISSLKDSLRDLEDGLTKGDRAMFYFFAQTLTDEELAYGAERIGGRISRIDREESKKKPIDKKSSDTK